MILRPRLFARFTALAAFCAAASTSFATLIVAHRGASYDSPENTVAATKLGYEQKADGVEFDVHLSKDGKMIVIHDATLKRTTGVEQKKVLDLTFDELRQLDAGKWKDPKFAGEKLPTVEEILAAVPAGKRIFIELKVGPEIVAPLVASLAKTKLKKEQITIIAFNYETLKESKKQLPELQCYWLLSAPSKDPKKPSPTLDEVLVKAKEAKFDGLDLNYGWNFDKATIDRVKKEGLSVHIWTVDDPAIAKQWTAIGVDSITTNRPAFLREALAKK